MSKKDKILKRARSSPGNFSYNELCSLAEHAGFEFRNQTGSHRIFKHPTIKKMLNLQPDKNDKSKAKKYQIKQVVAYIDDFNLMED